MPPSAFKRLRPREKGIPSAKETGARTINKRAHFRSTGLERKALKRVSRPKNDRISQIPAPARAKVNPLSTQNNRPATQLPSPEKKSIPQSTKVKAVARSPRK